MSPSQLYTSLFLLGFNQSGFSPASIVSDLTDSNNVMKFRRRQEWSRSERNVWKFVSLWCLSHEEQHDSSSARQETSNNNNIIILLEEF